MNNVIAKFKWGWSKKFLHFLNVLHWFFLFFFLLLQVLKPFSVLWPIHHKILNITVKKPWRKQWVRWKAASCDHPTAGPVPLILLCNPFLVIIMTRLHLLLNNLSFFFILFGFVAKKKKNTWKAVVAIQKKKKQKKKSASSSDQLHFSLALFQILQSVKCDDDFVITDSKEEKLFVNGNNCTDSRQELTHTVWQYEVRSHLSDPSPFRKLRRYSTVYLPLYYPLLSKKFDNWPFL